MSGFLLRSALRAVRMPAVTAMSLVRPVVPVRYKWQGNGSFPHLGKGLFGLARNYFAFPQISTCVEILCEGNATCERLINWSIPMFSIGIPTQEEQATGLEKLEYDALMAGVKDPWNMEVPTLGVATKDNPNIVYSMDVERIVGCICEEEQTYIMWWNLKQGDPVRCECGRWFQLKKGNPTKLNI